MTNFSNIKVFSTDLDGSLFKNDWTVSSFDEKILKIIQNKGIHVVLCSGRRCYESSDVFSSMGLKTEMAFVIGCSGAEIMKISNHQLVFESGLNLQCVDVIVDYCKKNGYCMQTYVEETHIAGTVDDEYHRYHFAGVKAKPLLFSFDEMQAYLYKHPPLKLFVCQEHSLLMSKIIPELSKILPSDCKVINTNPPFAEILPKHINKATALKWLCTNVFHCTMENVVSMGDGTNDVEMLAESGFSFAPSNAHDAAKRTAKLTVRWSNQESAVGHVLNDIFGLGEKDGAND